MASECTRGNVFGVFEHFRCRQSSKSAAQASLAGLAAMVAKSEIFRRPKADNRVFEGAR